MPIRYDFEHDIDSVFALLTDPDFIVDRSLDLGELEASCEVEPDGDNTVVTMMRKLEIDLPGFIARMIDMVQTLHITEQWQADGEGGWTGKYTSEMKGQPVLISANFKLYATDSGCSYWIEHKASVRIPLVGRKIEKFIQAEAGQGCTRELDYLRDRLG